jgi:hypothetical protein
MIDRLRSGEWLDARFVRTVSWLSLATSLFALLWLVLTMHGTVDALGRPVGSDFSNVWTAGKMALLGRWLMLHTGIPLGLISTLAVHVIAPRRGVQLDGMTPKSVGYDRPALGDPAPTAAR